jgi:hypothetical protein
MVPSLLKMGLLILFAWNALQGKESAAKGLAILLLLGAFLDAFGLFRASAQQPVILVLLILPLFHVGVAIYIFRSKVVREFFGQRTYASRYSR